MNTVEPIRDKSMVTDISDYLKIKNERDYVLFNMGIYVPMRISDLLKLKVRDVRNRSEISVREKKTGKEQKMPLNPLMKSILKSYIADKEDYEYLFASRQRNGSKQDKPISRQQAYNILNDAARHFMLSNIGCHTLRKTFGYHFYQQSKGIAELQEIFNHSSTNVTKRYIGLTQETKSNALKNFVL